MSDTVQNATSVANSESAIVDSNENTEEVLDNTEESDEDSELEASEAEGKSEEKPKKVEEKKKEAEKRIKKLKLKVDNKEWEEELDLDDEENLIKHLQLSKMGQKRAQEKAELEKQVGNLISALQDDPMGILAKELGMNPNEIIEKYIDEQLKQSAKTPEQVEREKLEKELKSLKAEREKETQDAQQRKLDLMREQEFQRYDTALEKALNTSNVPKTPYVIKKVADYAMVALDANFDPDMDMIMNLVKEEMDTDYKELLESMDDEKLEQLLGDQVINRLRKRRVAKAKDAQTLATKPKIEETGKKLEETKKVDNKQTFKEFFKI